ncbi:MAG: AAC(3) family N-acetyltransferase [Caldilineaceae bacterium]|nr:AAC(3) family N-acetyltransferase [Caldilineaceae bacterium]MBP8109269.1 AAC(3) family N-acetyltransferase [Caldilineaceae bacterium]MBP8123900.1 AAC(3) family N-acetyltransferase [Caldilineaceae bacterium]MBP9071829.1 AAC(3) family N-acetyltransferase [Caldilineaceae bacterium]
MSEAETIAATPGPPVTMTQLIRDLSALGVTPGMTLMVHSSLRSLGWVCNGPDAVVLALQSVVGEAGTLVMPAHSGQLTEPAHWQNPPVPESWWPIIRAEAAPYDPARTPTRSMGAIADAFRTSPDVRRSDHPHHSFAAWGRHRDRIVAGHSLDVAMGEGSPLAHIYELGGWVLLLGVPHANNTSLHLAEYRADFPGKANETQGAPMLVNGQRRWVEFETLAVDSDDFDQIGTAFAKQTGLVNRGRVGYADALLMPQPALIDFAVGWMEGNRRRIERI